MDYGKIINRSFQIAWQYKTLWLFGLFASGGSSNFNLDFNALRDKHNSPFGISGFNIPDEAIFSLITFALIFGFIVFLVGIIAEAALIDSVNKIERGGVYRFSDAFSAGINNFLKFLGLAILFFFTLMICIGTLVLIGVLAFVIHLAMGILYLLIAIPVFFLLLIVIYNIYALAQRSIVVRQNSIGDALEEAYFLLRKHFSKMVVLAFIYVGLAIGLGIVTFIIWLIINLPIGAITLAMDLNLVSIIIAAFIFGLPFSLIMGGILGTFFSSLYTKFYFELVEPTPTQSFAPGPAPEMPV